MINDLFTGTIRLLAQTSAPTTLPGEEAPWIIRVIQQGGILLPAGLFFAVFYFIVIRGKKKQEAAKKQEMEQIKKGDQIETIGGVIGSVVSIDDKTVVIKIDETANVKMKFNRRAIHKVIAADDKEKA